jgi:hypothetical protein
MDQLIASGNTRALQTIASGGHLQGGSADWRTNPGETLDWAGTNPQDVAERNYAQSLLSGNTQQSQQLAGAARAQHRDWTGGTLAGLAPAAAALIPGVGPLAAAGIGAAMGAAGRATGATRGSVLGGAVQGGALGGGASLLGGAIGGAGVPGGSGSGLLAGAGRALGSVGGVAGGVLGAAQHAIQNNPNLINAGLGILGTVQGAQREGQANQLRNQGLQSLQPGQQPDLSGAFADPGNPYASQQPGSALQAARASLRGY